MTEIDVELLERTMSFIEQHPELHDQEDWFNPCKTAYCFAGHAALLSGVEEPKSAGLEGDDIWGVTADNKSVVLDDEGDDPEGTRSISYYAQERLGLSFRQANAMFSGFNSREVLRHLVDALKADPDADLFAIRHEYLIEHPREGWVIA